MNPEIAARAEAVSKVYNLYDRPRDRLKDLILGPLRGGRREFWALRDVSFEVRRGEALGIIGQNGAGKSTLLQIITGILQPTSGNVSVRGRVAALLELGSGFNPDYTGRENVFLNGALLGLSRNEMQSRFDEIAAFADIGEFIDQPVRVYSSGMLVRLAFAVQAHVQADVLVVDEALSVGDVYFQHKCMRHIKRLLDQGVTLLFVSHSTDTVKRFCQRGLWLDKAQVNYFGEAGVAVEKYLAFVRMRELQPWRSTAVASTPAPGNGAARPLSRPLPNVPGEIDLWDGQLVLSGAWERETLPDGMQPALSTTDPAAQAGFCFEGSQLELAFWRGPEAGAARVVIDGVERRFDLCHPDVRRADNLHLVLESGRHTASIGLIDQGSRSGKLCWLGGRVSASPTIAFLRDPELAMVTSEIERYGSGKGRLAAVELLEYESECPISEVRFGQRVRLRLHAERLQPAGPRLEFSYIVRDRNRIDLFGTTTVDESIRLDPRAERFVVEFAFYVRLGPGSYSILA
ncbi:MAG TPA: ABC transporter ATP-binding protein, partial [Anaerolineales bacterium]|nr:ABC transporter ATP-binding protein [Anaerolineales bacterium]